MTKGEHILSGFRGAKRRGWLRLGVVVLVPLSQLLLHSVEAVAQSPTVSSGANQSFTVGDPATLISPITITDDAVTPTIRKKKDIRIRIPSGFNTTWDTTITTVTITGGAASKVRTTLRAYEDGNKTAVIDVRANFAAGDQITVSYLKFADFSAPSSTDNLDLYI